MRWTGRTSGRRPTCTPTGCTSRRAGNADNVFLDDPAGRGARTRRSRCPATIRRGLFWYHPHQPRRGDPAAAGRDGRARSSSAATSTRSTEVRGRQGSRSWCSSPSSSATTTSCSTRSPTRRGAGVLPADERAVHGQRGAATRRSRMYPGEVQRWRLLNAAEGNFLSLHLAEHEFHVLAWDGLTLRAPDPTERADDVGRQPRRGAGPGRAARRLRPGPDAGLQPEARHPRHAALAARRSPTEPRPMAGDARASRRCRASWTAGRSRPSRSPGTARRWACPPALPAFDPPILPIARRRRRRLHRAASRDGRVPVLRRRRRRSTRPAALPRRWAPPRNGRSSTPSTRS